MNEEWAHAKIREMRMNPEICGVGSEAGSLTDCGSSKGWQKSTGWRNSDQRTKSFGLE